MVTRRLNLRVKIHQYLREIDPKFNPIDLQKYIFIIVY